MRKLFCLLLGLGGSLPAMSHVTSTTTALSGPNLALGKPATASSSEGASFQPRLAFDADYGPRRASDRRNPATVATAGTSATTTSDEHASYADNAPPAVALTSPQAADYPRPSTITLTADASDSDGTIKQVAFYANGTLLTTDASSPYTYNWNATVAGVYTITAVATDNLGATTTSVARRLQVLSNPPVVSLASPVEQGTYTGPNVQIAVNASDPDGTVTKVEIYSADFSSVLLATLTAKPYAYTWTNVAPGTHTIFVRATDNSGRTADVRTTFTVLDPNNKAIPGRVEAESFDAQRGIKAEPTADAGGGQDVGYIDAGDYLDYKLTTTGGYYTVQFRVASWINNAQFEVQQLQGLEGVSTLATVTLPNTGGSQKWQTVSVDLPYGLAEGSVTLRLVAHTNGFNLNWLSFVRKPGAINVAPSVTLTQPILNRTYYNTLDLAADASDPDGTVSKVDFYVDNVLVGTDATAPYTATWPQPTAGTHVAKAVATDDRGLATTSEEAEFTEALAAGKRVPGKIEAESFDAQSGTITEATTDADGGQDVRAIEAGDYLNYKLVSGANDLYTVQVRVATTTDGAQLVLQRFGDGVAFLATVPVPNTGGGQKWQTVTIPNITLPTGPFTLRVAGDAGSVSVNWLSFSRQFNNTVSLASQSVSLASPLAAPALTPHAAELSAYPNPSTGLVRLTDAKEGAPVRIMDLNGTVVLTTTVRGNALDISKLPSGTYVALFEQDGKPVRLKLNKQ